MKKRIVIKVNGKNRTVCSIVENSNNNDLNIHITSGGKYYKGESFDDLVAGGKECDYVESSKYITIHNSHQSPNNNVIKRTIKFNDSEKSDQSLVQVSGAIKSGTDKKYTPALFRVCGNLSRDRYLVADDYGDELITLGEYEPSTDQLRFMLVVSAADKPFTPHVEHPSNNLRIDFSNFIITILWSYFNQASHPHAIDFFMNTSREIGPHEGFDWREIYNQYTDLNMAHANKYFEVYGVK